MLKKISENIWEFPYRAKLGPGISFPTRTTVFQLENKVILYSPGPFEKEDVELISSWGKEILIVAPNNWKKVMTYIANNKDQSLTQVAKTLGLKYRISAAVKKELGVELKKLKESKDDK